jgi:hypothetical protein
MKKTILMICALLVLIGAFLLIKSSQPVDSDTKILSSRANKAVINAKDTLLADRETSVFKPATYVNRQVSTIDRYADVPTLSQVDIENDQLGRPRTLRVIKNADSIYILVEDVFAANTVDRKIVQQSAMVANQVQVTLKNQMSDEQLTQLFQDLDATVVNKLNDKKILVEIQNYNGKDPLVLNKFEEKLKSLAVVNDTSRNYMAYIY